MNVLVLFIILFGAVAVSMLLFLIAGNANIHPIDTNGTTISAAKNVSAGNFTGLMNAGDATLPWIAFIIVIILAVAAFAWIYFNSGGSGGFKSKYR